MRFIKPTNFINQLALGWKLFRLCLHLIYGMALTLLFVQDGIRNSSRAAQLYTWWNKRLCNIFNAHISVLGKSNTGATLYVMNHISWFDIPALASLQPLHFLSKSEVRDWPVIGWLSHRAGTLFIRRGANGAAKKSLGEITHCLQQGGSVMLFPEGTTTDGSQLRNFHGRLLQAAIDANVKIQPIALRYPYKEGLNPHVPYIDDMTFMDSVKGLSKSQPLNVEIHFLKPIDDHLSPNKMTAEKITSRKDLALLAKQAIAKALRLTPSQ